MLRLAISCALLIGFAPASQAAGVCASGASETRHSASIGGKHLEYVACAGTLPVRSLKGTTGRIFYTAYIVPTKRTRPLSFIWNGGPGADSRLLHFHALGPRVFRGG
ncbi:MAG: peptidase S10, partial [Sphingomonas sp.]